MSKSHWEVFRRCLAIILRLQRGEAAREELLKEGYESSSDPDKQLENDVARLRSYFEVVIHYDHKVKVYRLYSLGNLYLFELPPEALKAIRFLEDTFTRFSPHYRQVAALLDALRLRLPPDQLENIRYTPTLQIDLEPRDDDVIPDEVMKKLGKRNCRTPDLMSKLSRFRTRN